MLQLINKYCIYVPVQFVRGEHIWKILPEFAECEQLTREELKNYTYTKIQDFVRNLYNGSQFYRDVFNEIDFNPKAEFDYEIFQNVPILTKDHIRKIGFDTMSLKGRKKAALRSTSGSTGKPFVFPKDVNASTYMEAVMYQVYNWYGIEIGDRQARFWGTPVNGRALLFQRIKDRALNRRRLSAFELNERTNKSFWKILKSFKPAYFYGYPNVIASFARYVIDNNIRGEELELKVIICTGEILVRKQRELISEAFCCRVANEYGSTENGIIAFECPSGEMHILNQNIFLECIALDGRLLPIGERGKFVITEFHSNRIPFLRYDLGDWGRILERKCVCGRPFPLLDVEIGRIDSFIATPDGKKVYDAILAYVFKNSFKQFRGIQDSPENLIIQYVSPESLKQKDLEKIEKRLRKHIGNAIQIKFEQVEKISPDASGKLRYFVSRMPSSNEAS